MTRTPASPRARFCLGRKVAAGLRMTVSTRFVMSPEKAVRFRSTTSTSSPEGKLAWAPRSVIEWKFCVVNRGADQLMAGASDEEPAATARRQQDTRPRRRRRRFTELFRDRRGEEEFANFPDGPVTGGAAGDEAGGAPGGGH